MIGSIELLICGGVLVLGAVAVVAVMVLRERNR
jgi:hypothetical protein